MRNQRGFTLLESLIVITIITIMTGLSLGALSTARAHQQLIADTELVRSLILDAKERTINQLRPDKCLPSIVDNAAKAKAVCSDVGISFDTVKKTVTEFADTYPSVPKPDKLYTPCTATNPNACDFRIVTHPVSSVIGTASTATTLLFNSDPPSTTLYYNGVTVLPAGGEKTIILDGLAGLSRKLTVHSYGTIDVEEL